MLNLVRLFDGRDVNGMEQDRFGLVLKIGNIVVGVGSLIVVVLIVGLFWLQPKSGAAVKANIGSFEDNSDEYFSEDEAYQQLNDNIKTFQAKGRPDKK